MYILDWRPLLGPHRPLVWACTWGWVDDSKESVTNKAAGLKSSSSSSPKCTQDHRSNTKNKHTGKRVRLMKKIHTRSSTWRYNTRCEPSRLLEFDFVSKIWDQNRTTWPTQKWGPEKTSAGSSYSWTSAPCGICLGFGWGPCSLAGVTAIEYYNEPKILKTIAPVSSKRMSLCGELQT